MQAQAASKAASRKRSEDGSMCWRKRDKSGTAARIGTTVRTIHSADPLTDGRFVSAPVKLLATHREEVGGFPATGRFVVVHAVLICELDPRGELLWRVRAFFDLYDAGIQLGVLPRRGGLGERAMFLTRGFGLRRLRT